MIQITENAAQHIQRVRTEEKAPESNLRVQVIGGGCSGLSYKLKFDSELKGDDKVFEQFGVKVITDPKSYLYLIGMTLDYEGGLNGQGFTFKNPNAKKSCGCGSSFAV